MKVLKLVLIVILMSNFYGKTQEIADSIKSADLVNLAYEARMDEIFENIDFSYIPSGKLYERGFPFITLEPFNGQITDSSKSNLIIFSLAYASLVTMSVDSTAELPDPSSYRNIMDTINPNSTVIAVAGMHQLYNTIDTSAFTTGLLAVVGENYADVLPRESSPYIDKEVFMFAPAEIELNNPVFSLYFDSGLFYNNSGKTVDSLFIDTGMGFQAIQFDENIQLAYAGKGRKLIKIKLKYTDESVYYSHFDLIIKGQAFRGVEESPDFAHYINGYTLTEDPSSGQGGGWIYTYLACGHERIEKPFIWAEAFNPSVGAIDANLTKELIIERLNHADGKVDGKPLLDYLTENGYDIIILDYDNGADYLPRTAAFIEQAIEWVNLQKHSAGSNAQNIILGQSMGGVATMQALRHMENTDTPHECEKFIVFDSPIMGVNIPMTAQASLLDMATLWVNKPLSFDDRMLFQYVEIIEDIVRLLYLPATRTMMIEQCNDVLQNEVGFPAKLILQNHVTLTPGTDDDGYIQTDHLFDEHYDYIHNFLGGMPEDCEVLTITNGSALGEDGQHDFQPGNLLVQPKINNMTIGALIAGYLDDEIGDGDLSLFNTSTMSGVYGLLLWKVGVIVYIDIKMYAMKNETNFKYYKNSTLVKLPFLSPTVYHYNNAKTSTGKEIDHVPGGFFGLGNQGIFFPSGSSASNALQVFRMHTWCFTPTGSVLNYHGDGGNIWLDEPNRNYADRHSHLLSDKTRGVSSYMANTLTPSFAEDPLEDEYNNTAHTWFTSQSSSYLVFNLVGANELEGIVEINYGATFNYGRADLTPETDYFGLSLPVRTSSILDHSLVVNNSEFNVNENNLIGLTPSPYAPENLGNSSANSHFVMFLGPICNPLPKVTLELKANAEMKIGDGDSRTGSVLVQDGHEIVVNTDGKIRIKKGSTLKINSGGSLKIEDGGIIIIEDGASLIVEEGGTIEYYEGGVVHLNGEYSRLIIDGLIHLHENAIFMPLHEGVNSGVVIVNSTTGALNGETGSAFRLIGDGNDDHMLTITEYGHLNSNADMSQLMLASCHVVFRSFEDYGIKSYSPFSSINVVYTVQFDLPWDATEPDFHPSIGLYNKSKIISSNFTDVILKCEDATESDEIFIRLNNSDFELTYLKEDIPILIKKGNLYMYNCELTNYEGDGIRLEDQTVYSQINSSIFNKSISAAGRHIYKNSDAEVAIRNCSFFGGEIGVFNTYGQVTLRCNTFSHIAQFAIFGGYNTRVEMSNGYKAGYNQFDNIGDLSVKLVDANFLSISNGNNYFWNDETSAPTIEGSLNLGLPPALVLPGHRNQWNTGNTEPASTEIALLSTVTGSSIGYNLSMPQSGICGAFDTDNPIEVPIGGGAGSYMPVIDISGQSNLMRLDSAIVFARSGTVINDSTANDLDGIYRYSDILNYNYSQSQLEDLRIRYYLLQAYAEMKFTIGHAISDSTILRSHNQTQFDSTVQKYVDVLNHLTIVDTFSIADYRQRFSLELDKAHLFRMLGHTQTGLDILQNLNLCNLDSTEQVVLNDWMFVYEEQLAKQNIGFEAYGIDTVYTDTSGYQIPTSTQATQFTFGSVINSLTSINYRSCSGSLKPEEDETNRASSFTIYPNPSDGIVNLKYQIPSEKNAELMVYSINGQVIYRTWLNEGANTATIDLSNVESGLYLYTVMIEGAVEHAGRISIAK